MAQVSSLGIGGNFNYICYDKEGNLKWKETAKNGATTLGLNYVLDAGFHGTTPVTTWYCGLITTGSALTADDTLASHSGWTEGTDYTGNRKEWTEGAASSKSMTNAVTMDYAISNTMTVKGSFLCASETGTGGILFCTALFTGGDQAVSNGDTLKVTYTLSASPL